MVDGRERLGRQTDTWNGRTDAEGIDGALFGGKESDRGIRIVLKVIGLRVRRSGLRWGRGGGQDGFHIAVGHLWGLQEGALHSQWGAYLRRAGFLQKECCSSLAVSL